MSLKRRFTGAVVGVGAALAVGSAATAETANETTAANQNSPTVVSDLTLTDRFGDILPVDYNEPVITLAQNAAEPGLSEEEIQEIAATLNRNARLIYEVASMVASAAYVELDQQEITNMLWDALPDEHIRAVGGHPDHAPTQVNVFFAAFQAIYLNVIIPQGIDLDEYTATMMNEFLGNIDAHSSYHPPVEFEDVSEQSRGSFGGVGIQLNRDEDSGYIHILGFSNAVGGSPAEDAGAEVGDIITHVDGVDISDLPYDEVRDLIRGRPGSDVDFTVIREGADQEITLTIERAVIAISPVASNTLANGQVGYVALSSFTRQAEAGIAEAIEEMEARDNPPSAYILDLRGNPGGLLDQASGVADLFLNSGDIVSSHHRRGMTAPTTAEDGDIINGKPLIVLVNGRSASASEIVSGVLQEHDRAEVVGVRSFGKGSVQIIMPLQSTGGGLRLTTALYMVAGNRSIQGHGVEPDIAVTFGLEALLDEHRINEADQDHAILNERTPDQVIEDDDLQCVLNGDRDDVMAALDGAYIRTNSQTGETIIDSSLLCAVEHLLGQSTHTIRELEPDAAAVDTPAITRPRSPAMP